MHCSRTSFLACLLFSAFCAPVHAEQKASECQAGFSYSSGERLSNYWELSNEADCGSFRLRGYRPISVGLSIADSVNNRPMAPSPGRQPEEAQSFDPTEARLQFSLRTKLATGLLPREHSGTLDSLWFAYTQQSYWQVFSGDNSKPFRTTDHEPELIYIYPLWASLPMGWNLKYVGLSLSHQSNGESLPYSRSWNRWIASAGLERSDHWYAVARAWWRLPGEGQDDDNPEILRKLGRAELQLAWQPSAQHLFSLSLRHALTHQESGAVVIEWFRPLAADRSGRRSNLALHARIFSGYGDSLIDYNYRRTVVSYGLSLIDF
jgi:phospholipase A1